MEKQSEQYDNRNFERGFDYFFDKLPPAPNGVVEVVTECGEAFERMLAAIRQAQCRVWLMMYVLDDDALGRRFERALAGCAAAGVDVRVLCDGYGCWASRLTLLRRLRRQGVRVVVCDVGAGEWIDQRNHRKMLIVDDRAFVGGMNIAVRYLRRWRDVCLCVEGEVVGELERLFVRDWNGARKGELLHWSGRQGGCVRLLSKRCDVERAFVGLVGGARRRVLLSTPYLVPPDEVEQSLAESAGRGVGVTVLIPARSDVAVMGAATMACAVRLARCGVEVWRYVEGFNHAKVLVVDDVAMVGSANCDYRSLRRNRELMVAFRGEAVERLTEDFGCALEGARRLTVTKGESGVVERIVARAIGWLSPLL